MDKYKLIRELISEIERFEVENINFTSTKEFIQLLFNDNNKKEIIEYHTQILNSEVNINGEISRYIARLNRFAAIHSKSILKDLPFVSLTDFGYLANSCSR